MKKTECKIISQSEDGVVAFVADKGLVPGEPRWANYIKVHLYIQTQPAGLY